MVQEEIKKAIFDIAKIVDVDPALAMAIAKIESGFGFQQKSKTGARGIFQMTSIAMKDLLLYMESHTDDIVDILVGLAFLKVLSTRWNKDEQRIAEKYCDPKDRDWYPAKALELAETYRREIIDKFCR